MPGGFTRPGDYDSDELARMDKRDLDALTMLELRRMGWTHREIAKEFGLKSEKQAFDIIIGRIALLTKEVGEDVKTIELDRLDGLFKLSWKAAHAGSASAVENCLKIMNRRAQLLGLDAPAKVDITHRVREMATRMGLDPDLAERQAEELIRQQFEHVRAT